MKKKTNVYVRMDVHKESVTVAGLVEGERGPALVKRLSHDPRRLRRLLDRLAGEHEVRARYEASGAGYVLERKVFLPLWPEANRRISGGFTVDANLGRPLPSAPERQPNPHLTEALPYQPAPSAI